MHVEMECIYFYKNSANRTFTFIASKVFYFKKHCISIIAPLGSDVSTAIKYSVSLRDN